MDNHLWEHEDIEEAELIVCVWTACDWAVLGSGCPAVQLGYTKGLCWWWITVIACSGWEVCAGLCYIHIVQAINHIIDLCALTCLFILSYLNLKSLLHSHTQMLHGACGCIRSPPTHHLNVVHFKLVQPQLFQLTLFPLQMTAPTWEMSGSLSLPALFGFFKHLWSVKLISAA